MSGGLWLPESVRSIERLLSAVCARIGILVLCWYFKQYFAGQRKDDERGDNGANQHWKSDD